MNSLDRRSFLVCLGGVAAAGTLVLAPSTASSMPLASGGASVLRTGDDSLIEEARSRRVCRWHRGRQICHWQRWTCWWRRGRRVCGWR
jgi:hypothetical protein